MAMRHLQRYGLLLGLIALILLVHSLQAHREYRVIFAVIPLWLLTGADLVMRMPAHGDRPRHIPGFATAGFSALCLAVILNALPC